MAERTGAGNLAGVTYKIHGTRIEFSGHKDVGEAAATAFRTVAQRTDYRMERLLQQRKNEAEVRQTIHDRNDEELKAAEERLRRI